jgi:hypothetical protein
MNPRERVLAMIVVSAVLLAATGFLFYQLFLSPLRAKDAGIQTARDDIEKKTKELQQARIEHAKLERMKALSLPGDPNIAAREYEKYLREILTRSRFSPDRIEITARPPDAKGPQLGATRKQQPVYTTIGFVVDATGRLESLVQAMESFYRAGLLHAIRDFSIDIPPVHDVTQQRPDELKIKLTIEALIVTGADNRPYLLPNIDRRLVAIDAVTALRGGPAGLAWGAWALSPAGPRGPAALATKPRKYSAIAAKNIFTGPPERQEIIAITKYVYLTHIIVNDRYSEAYLNDRFNETERQLRNQPGFNQVTIPDTSGESVITVKVVQIDPRDLVFSIGDNYYSMHVGQNLAEAMRNPLSAEQVEALLKDRAAALSK